MPDAKFNMTKVTVKYINISKTYFNVIKTEFKYVVNGKIKKYSCMRNI